MYQRDQFSILNVLFRLTAVLALAGLLLSWSAPGPVSAQTDGPGDGRETGQGTDPGTVLPTDQIIIQFKPRGEDFRTSPQALETVMAQLSAQAGVELQYARRMSGEADVLRLPERMAADQVQAFSDRLMALPEVEYAEPDAIMLPTLIPNDPQYPNQWHYYDTYGIDMPAAWNITTGSASVVVAVIDTGILPTHADLAGRTIGGYDFIADSLMANDGGGRDANPADPGDWITYAESVSGYFAGCPQSDSSWHGSHVGGTIGAKSNNALGVAGINWVSKILPVRVLGKCGGYLSDIADGMRWSAGLAVTGVPANPNPAKVLNMSLGGYGACGTTYQNAINAINSLNANVVVAAGNSSDNAASYRPANCSGVITVAASDETGDLASFSNYSTSVVEISAPGTSVLSTVNTGTTVPVSDTYEYYNGTSMATPHVSGVVSLMLSVNPSLSRAKVLEILQNTSLDFPSGSSCEFWGDCGAGILDADGAVKGALFASWAGSVTVTSPRQVVSVARPHVGTEVASYGGSSAGSTTNYLPMLFKDSFGGSYDSAFYLQNTNPTLTSSISIDFYDSAGTLSCHKTDTLAPLASKGYWVPSEACLPAGWVGGAVVTSDRLVVAVGRPHVGSEVMTYNGFTGSGLKSYLPMLFKNAFGGSYDAAFYVQNVTGATANVDIDYYDNAGTLSCHVDDTVAPHASKGYWVPSVGCLPVGWVGGAIVTSDQQVVSVSRLHVGSQVTTYNGFHQIVPFSFVPMLFKNAFGGSYDAAFYIQNVSETPGNASVTIKYYDSAGTLTCTVGDTIAQRASKGYWVPSVGCLPVGWVGGAVITADRQIVTVGRPHVGTQVTAYSGLNAFGLTSYMPMLFRDAFGGSYDSAFYIQNLDGSSGPVTLSFYDAAGTLLCTRTDTIAANATLGYWVPSVVCDP